MMVGPKAAAGDLLSRYRRHARGSWVFIATSAVLLLAAVLAGVVLVLAKFTRVSAQSTVLAGIAVGAMFSAGLTLIQYLADSVQLANIISWTFGDLGRADWRVNGAVASAVVPVWIPPLRAALAAQRDGQRGPAPAPRGGSADRRARAAGGRYRRAGGARTDGASVRRPHVYARWAVVRLPASAETEPMILNVDGVEFGYSSAPILRGVSFSVDGGELLAIMGPNGFGKTTLLKCLNRVLNPRAGSVFIAEVELRTIGRREIARRVGFVAQQSEAYRMTVYDVLMLGRVPRRRSSCMNWGPWPCAAPTSSLDLRTQHHLMATITRVAESTSVAVVMSVHDINLAIRYATKLVMMRDGTVLAAGDRSVITEGTVQAVYGIDVAVGDVGGVPCVIPR